MIDVEIDVNSFNEEFKKRFTNFCMKAPVFITFTINGPNVNIYKTYMKNDEKKTRLLLSYKLDYTIDVKLNIFKIKEFFMKNLYPKIIFTKTIQRTPSIETLNELIANKTIDMFEAPSYKESVTQTKTYIIEKAIIERDELFLLDVDSSEKYRYKLKKPVSYFLRSLENYTPEEAGEIFLSSAKLIS